MSSSIIPKAGITQADIDTEAADIKVPSRALAAILHVETSGFGFLQDNKPKVLFERHIFYKQLVALGKQDLATKLMTSNPSLCNTTPGGYSVGANAEERGQREHQRLATAASYCREAALNSASWGVGQLMGFNWKQCGYASQQQFINAMYGSSLQQLDGMTRFIKSIGNLLRGLQATPPDWQAVARFYNGERYRDNKYDTKLASWYASGKG